MLDGLRAYLQIANGLTEVTRQRALAVARSLAEQSEEGIAAVVPEDLRGQIAGMADDLVALSRTNRALLRGVVTSEVERAVARLGLVAAAELGHATARAERLEGRLHEVERQLSDARRRSDGGSRDREEPADTAAVARRAAKKAAAKRSATARAASSDGAGGRPAAGTAAARRAAAGAPAARKGTARTSTARQGTGGAATADNGTPGGTATRKTTARAGAARRTSVEKKRAPTREASAGKTTPAKSAAAKATPAREASRKTTPARETATGKTATGKTVARRTTAEKSTAPAGGAATRRANRVAPA